MKNKQKLFFPFVFFVILGAFFIKPPKKITPLLNSNNITPFITLSPSPLVDYFEYSGVDGVDALTLLKQKTSVKQDSSGIVTSISGRQSDNSKREFWSFYINGKSAQVGPASYITDNNDIIIWKIEKY